MKKHSFAVLALAAAMTFGSAMTAMAAEGWAQENGNWVYYNAAGNKMTQVWRTGADGLWRYVNEYGVMACSCWVDDDNYYVGDNGVMLASQWLEVANSEKETGRDYYYLSATGKAVKGKWEKINNQWYHFDDEGVMETGWIMDNMYYCGEDGAMVTGWQKLVPPDGEEDDDDDPDTPYQIEEDGKHWYYFSTSGKKVVPKDGDSEIATKKINGSTYVLDENGAVKFGWVSTNGTTSDSIGDYRYVDSNGVVRTGWYSITPPQNLRNNYEHDVEWFYFSSKGEPTVGPMRGAATYKDLKKIGNYTYLFDDTGIPVYGLQKVYTDSQETNYTAYYFGTRQQSSLIKSKKISLNVGGDTEQYYFDGTGKGYTGVYDSYLYYMGKLQKAETSNKYEVFSLYSKNGNNVTNYVVNTSGKIVKNTTVKDKEGTKYKTNSSGVLILMDDEEVEDEVFTLPTEPDWDYFN